MMTKPAISVKEIFFNWLSREVTTFQLSELYFEYAEVEKICLKWRLLKSKLFETTDLDIINNLLLTFKSNNSFRLIYKGNMTKMRSALHLYYRFLKENPNYTIYRNDEKSCVLHEQVQSDLNDNNTIIEKPSVKNALLVDFNSDEKLLFTKPLSFNYFDEEQTNIVDWTQLYVSVVRCLIEDYPHIFERMVTSNNCSDFSGVADYSYMTAPKKVVDNIYIETNLDASDIISKIIQLLDACNVDYENLKIYYCFIEKPILIETDNRELDTGGDVHKNRIAFIEWMKSTGESLANIFNCLSAISYCSKVIQENEIDRRELITIYNVAELNKIKDKLFSVVEFSELNFQQNDRFYKTFDRFIAFRLSTKYKSEPGKMKNTSSVVDVNHNLIKNKYTTDNNSRFSNILAKYFIQDGYQPGRAIFYDRFKRYYANEYGFEPTESDNNIDEILSKVGTYRDGRLFPKQDDMQNNIIDDIVEEIWSALDGGVSAVYNDAVFEKYRQQLADNLQIYHVGALTPLLLEKAKGKYIHKYSYFTSKNKSVNSADDILREMKQFNVPQTLDAIHEKTWYIPYSKLKQLISLNKSIVKVGTGTYFYAPNFPICSSELKQLISAIQKELECRDHITDIELMELIKDKFPSIAINTEDYSAFGLRNCLGYMLKQYFSFNGPIISKFGNELSMGDIFAEFSKAHEILQVQELDILSRELNTNIYWDSVFDEMIRVSEFELVRKDLISFDVDAIDDILDEICPDDYAPLKDIKLFLYFPNIEHQWNSYVLESYLYSCSRKYKLLHSSFSKNQVYGAMVRKESLIKDYRSLLVDVLSRSNALDSSKSALQFIVDQGYQQRRRYEGIDQLILEAKQIKDNKELQLK